MAQRFRWTHTLADGREATVSRVAGAHEDGDDPRRRYDCRLPADVAASTPDERVRLTREGDGDRLTVVVPDGVGVARLRLATDDGRTALPLSDPTLGGHLTAALRGDDTAARALADHHGSATAAVHACAHALDTEGVVALVDALASASGAASDDLHARRYALCRAAARGTNGLAVDEPDAFETLADGLDSVEGIGDVEALDALGDLVAVHGLDDVRALGYDLVRLAHRDDGRFRAYWLAALARDSGIDAARDVAGAGGDGGDYARLKERALDADYAERGAAWRALCGPASRRSRETFRYVLANAYYWTGETSRTDARADELCYDGALAAVPADLDWIRVRARYERARAVGHRHRSATNHALAVAAFERARRIAEECPDDDVTPWDPLYSRTVVASNARSAAGDHAAAVDVIEDGLDALDDYAIPDARADEVRHHLRGQRHERLALLARREEAGAVETHLDAAREHYEAAGLERSRERVAAKRDDAANEDATDRERRATRATGGVGPAPRPPSDDTGPSLADIPDLHDFLTESDPTAVGSADPGVVDRRPRDPGPY
ncbi:hypothetical protein J2752_000683 [Halarchaeum rubridurum]|uniref:Uncharacterized protein n=1 Tax=Halarchaeum rubridurum TaxID=489911 RepID=A0A830FXE2_9EURY|nr:hypothetical protein [Halarchaeum rubridurum]MBP1953802.1 hypothetical protein [Halarchaeum rubridurum]GGM54796.1 hypothetical protein GCM10009017_01420 [Halarchaeum rubridurum]